MKISRNRSGSRYTSKTLARGPLTSRGYHFAFMGAPPTDASFAITAEDDDKRESYEVTIESEAEAKEVIEHLEDFLRRRATGPFGANFKKETADAKG